MFWTEKKFNFTPIAIMILVATLVNICASFFITKYLILENEYRNFGSKENYEKSLIVSNAQYEQAFGKYSKEEVKAQIEQALWIAPAENTSWVVSSKELAVSSPVLWKTDAKISIYEFSDLECPYCKQFHDSWVIKQVLASNSEDVNYVFKNFPLNEIHAGAQSKAEAGLCIYELSGNTETYYSYIDKVFEKWTSATNEDILAIAKELWVDETGFSSCLTSGKHTSSVNADLTQGMSNFKVSWTPSVIVVNNETGKWAKLESRNASALQSLIDSLK